MLRIGGNALAGPGICPPFLVPLLDVGSLHRSAVGGMVFAVHHILVRVEVGGTVDLVVARRILRPVYPGRRIVASEPQALLAELSEAAATGRIAEIYDEIRRFSGVPYVSSLQRYLATMPGVLEWAWDAVRPALVSGVVQETGWRLAKAARLSAAGPVS